MDLSAALPSPTSTPPPTQWHDDFSRVVATRSPDRGLSIKRYDAANRLVAMRDALGNKAQYAYDVRGRIVKQTIESGDESIASVQTAWRYEGDHLVELIHPTQSEQYSYDERGLRTSKTVLRESGKDSTLTAITRYAYNEQGHLIGISLPDGSWITYSRNGQGQVVALKRSPIHPQHLRWLAWLLPEQTIAQDFERDMVGVRSYTQGNGLQTRYQRSQEGVLARVFVSKPIEALSKTEQAKAADKLLQMLGIQAALAQQDQASKQAPSKAQAADTLATLGALGIQTNPQALIDHRYLWDTRGNLLYTRSGAKQTEVQTYAYDGANRLVVSVASEGKAENLKERAVNRYFYQGAKRVLQQQNAATQSDLNTHTLRVNHKAGTHQWTGSTQTDASFGAEYDAAGQPSRLGQRRFKWDAYGRLAQVSSEANKLTASYTYNHRGERIHKTVGNEDTAYLYDDSRQLQAELNDKQRITRQYIYLADMPLAVIDTPEGLVLEEPRNGIAATLHELVQVISAVFTSQDQITYLHTNHLGAVEAATNAKAQMVWQAAYEPFGKAHVQTHGASKAFALNLRLPGQYEDAETGLHYNDHRYYDPARGEYISPDPLGNPDGPNTYAYVAYNPLNAIDPLGLILFAFDGTGNSMDDAQLTKLGNSWSNVAKFYDAYNEDVNGPKFYITGIGTTSERMAYEGSMKTGDGFKQRVELGFDFLNEYIDQTAGSAIGKKTLDIDVIGFSRGAAEARAWVNEVVKVMEGSIYTTKNKNSRCVNFRFEGLWDTVPHYGAFHQNEDEYDFGIPAAVKLAVHAVAVNEHRGGPADFDTWSIHWSASTSNTSNRIEQGFIGAHSDVGGGYTQGDLSDVALMWMFEQAERQGVKFDNTKIEANGWSVVSNPLIHDPRIGDGFTEFAWPDKGDRDFNYLNGTSVPQQTALLHAGVLWTGASRNATLDFVKRCGTDGSVVGMVNMATYADWLKLAGLTYEAAPAAPSGCTLK